MNDRIQNHTAAPDLRELRDDVSASPYFSSDMAPVPAAGRKWSARDLAVLWISLSACVPTYMLASGNIAQGMNWWQAVLTIFLGNCIVLIPMSLNAHAGTRYGIPYPVYCRTAFGLRGANVPALMRALVACGWFGIQTWIGGMALHTLLAVWFPQWKNAPALPGLDITLPQLACFLAFWFVNVFVVWRGIQTIRVLLNIKAPLLIILGLLLLAWAYVQADGFGPMLSQPSAFAEGQPKSGQFWACFVPALTASVSFWATLSLNISDFSRYAKSQRDQVLGQALGLPATMALYAFIGVAVTSATVVIYGEAIWDPVQLLAKFENPLVLIGAMFCLCLATLATNIAANVVGPANDFANLWPKWISFRVGGVITGVIGILIQPWRLLANAEVYIDKWLVGYSVLLGACGGVLIADYWIVRRGQLDLAGLYRREGPYWYRAGWNPLAFVALVAGIAPCLPGFAAKVGLVEVHWFWSQMYDYAWFVSFGVSFVMYVVLMMTIHPRRDHKASEQTSRLEAEKRRQEQEAAERRVEQEPQQRAQTTSHPPSTPIVTLEPAQPERVPGKKRTKLAFLAAGIGVLVLLVVCALGWFWPITTGPAIDDDPLSTKFVHLSKGTFYMGGGHANILDRSPEELAGYTTQIKEEFEIAVYPVTQGQWQALMGNNPSWFSRDGRGANEVRDIADAVLKQFPVEMVTCGDGGDFDVKKFVARLNEREKGSGWLYRLPSEAEWEYACRGGATSQQECSYDFYFGRATNDGSSYDANFCGLYPLGEGAVGPYLQRPTQVGSYKPNKLGLHDMHGNVMQWCLNRMTRGGCWDHYGWACRASYRESGEPSYRWFNLGFRLARVPSSE